MSRSWAVGSLVALALAAASQTAAEWRARAPLPVARTEVAAATVGGEIAVAGGFVADGSSSRRVDLYAPSTDRWRRVPDLPVGVDHAMAAALAGRLYVVGGYSTGGAGRAGSVLRDGLWRALPPMPAPRAAGGAAVLGGRVFVVGGVGAAGLARIALAYDPRARRWTSHPGPTPREHLAVAVAGGRIYAIAGRTAGIDTNLTLVESWRPGERRWRGEPSVPESRGGTGAASLAGVIVSVGGEEPAGAIGTVYAYDVARRTWRRLPDLPTPRHGVGVVALGGAVYAVGGGPRPGLHVSAANEALRLG